MMGPPNSLARDISPPPSRPSRKSSGTTPGTHGQAVASVQDANNPDASEAKPSLAAIEAGETEIRDHLEYFSKHLQEVSKHTPPSIPRITIDGFQDLYKRNQHPRGHHFVIHQHDHPISGLHYDLRLQFSETSTVSFAVPYGLPGNPNSLRPNRMAIETRVHNLWNNLIESASHATGSLLIWDTGEYEVLPYREVPQEPATDDESLSGDESTKGHLISDSEKLFAGFQTRHIRLRLHGTKLPQGYTIGLRLPSANDRKAQPKKPVRKRRRIDPAKASVPASPASTTDSENDEDSGTIRQADAVKSEEGHDQAKDAAIASEDEDTAVRSNNAYTGASNTIGSVHQRHWFLSLDRSNSGFYKARSGADRGRWIGGWGPFFVLGRDVERSVVSGRSADEVMADEGVEKFMGRKMWRPITE